MKIYFVENTDYNTLVAVENGKGKTITAPDEIDIYERDAEGTLQTEKIVDSLKQYFTSEPLNDYVDIYSDNEFDWEPDDYNNVTQVF